MVFAYVMHAHIHYPHRKGGGKYLSYDGIGGVYVGVDGCALSRNKEYATRPAYSSCGCISSLSRSEYLLACT